MQPVMRIFCAGLSLLMMTVLTTAQTTLTAKTNSFQPNTTEGPGTESDRVRDGLTGPVRRVRTEVVKLTNVAGKSVEEPKRVVL